MPDTHWNDKKLKLPALHQAARRGELAKVKQLLKGKAKADEAGEFGDTPIMWAAYEGNASVVAYLIAAGANVKAADTNKTTPLHNAAANGHCEIITALLSKGANAKAIDGGGLMPMHWAAAGDYPDAIQVLIQNKVSADVPGGDGKTALHYAAYYGHPAAIRALVKGGANVNRADKEKATPLHDAAEKGRVISVEALINGGANLNAKDENGRTPLHYAAHNGHADIVEQLVESGADMDKGDNDDRTPLFYSQRSGCHDVTKMLIEMGGFATAKPPEKQSVAEAVFNRAYLSVVFIQTNTSQGSGVVVQDDIVVTNYHVVRPEPGEKQSGLFVYKPEGRQINKWDKYEGKPMEGDLGRDFCILHVPGLGCNAAAIRPYHTLRVGEDVYAIGNPMGETLTLSEGVISQIRDEGERRTIQTNAAISPGSSGGGLFDKDGNLIGITTESLRHSENINYAIAADLFWGFLPGKR